MKKLCILLLVFFMTYHLSANVNILVEHIKQSIQKAEKGLSKLHPDILKLPGMSSAKGRHLLNNICTLPNTTYFEVGVWKGSTFIAALYKNNIKEAAAVDNWSEFDGPKEIFRQNAHFFLNKNSFKFYDEDCFSLDILKLFKAPVTTYFYDGAHDYESQKKAFTYFNPILANTFIAIVDDWNAPQVKQGTRDAFKELKYYVHYEFTLPAQHNGDTTNFWNGIYIAIISKPTGN